MFYTFLGAAFSNLRMSSLSSLPPPCVSLSQSLHGNSAVLPSSSVTVICRNNLNPMKGPIP